jgi:hypothetical protein
MANRSSTSEYRSTKGKVPLTILLSAPNTLPAGQWAREGSRNHFTIIENRVQIYEAGAEDEEAVEATAMG